MPVTIGICFRLSMVGYSTPAETDRSRPPTRVSPAGYVKSALPKVDATACMVRWYCCSFWASSFTWIYSSRPPLISTLATEDSFSNSGTISLEVPCLWVVHRQVDAGRIIDVKFHDVRRLGILREVPLEGIQLFL